MKAQTKPGFMTRAADGTSAHLLRDVLDNLFAFVGVLDLEGRMMEANRAPLEAAGISREDVIGRYFWDCPWWSWSVEARERLQQTIARAVQGETLRYDTTIAVADSLSIIIDFQLAPLKDEHGRVVSLVASGTDITWRKNVERELQTALVRTELALEAGQTGVWEADLQSGEMIWDTRMRTLFAIEPHIPVTQDMVDRLIHPDDLLGARNAASQATDPSGDGEYEADFRLVHPEKNSHQEFWIAARGRCLFEGDTPVRMIGIARDITERKQREAHVHMLMREIAHRSKNLLAVIQAMARQTATAGGSAKDFETRFTARLEALAGSQDLVMMENWHGASLKDLAYAQLAYLTDFIGSRIVIEGPDLMLKPEAAQNIGLALHELATNAAKFGALSNDTGRVHLSWAIRREGRHPHLCMTWRETLGPPVKRPSRQGFGHKVLQRIAAHALEGKVKLDFAPDGLVWRLDIPTSYIVHGRDAHAADATPVSALGVGMRSAS